VSSSNDVLRYFDDTAEDFDTIYREQQPVLRRLRDRVRGTVTKRLEFVQELVASERCRSILDVGCGSGRFGLALARRGVVVHGIDFAPQMISLARELAAGAGVSNLATFDAVDFLTWSKGDVGRYDLGIAMGVLDYVDDPVAIVSATASLVDRVAISFPKRLHPLVPARIIKFRRAGCPLFLYRKSDVMRIASDSGLTEFEVRNFRRDYLLLARIT
jgi:2-polyprenyl-3-methyl-5-hydroxy-6-metoxy-1,4-benzoquinol methylase